MTNKIVLLLQYKMMLSKWNALTPDSYYTELVILSDEEIKEFYEKAASEIEQITYEVDHFFQD